MAEFLIKNQVSGGELRGDIVEVYPDGTFAAYTLTVGPGRKLEFDPDKFIIIRVPGLGVGEAIHLMDSLIDDSDPENPVVLHRRRYSITDALPFLAPYHVSGNIYEVPVHASWNSFLKDKEA